MPHASHLLSRCLAVLSLVATAALAAPKADLARLTPVPDNEQIPVLDFFRPDLLFAPKINPSGTHIAALISPGDDKYKLLVWNIESKQMESIGGMGDRDIFHFDWLGDKRLMFGVSTEKLQGLGWMVANVGRLSSAYPVFQYCGTTPISVPVNDRLHPLVWLRGELLDDGFSKDGGVVQMDSNLESRMGLTNLNSAKVDWALIKDVIENNDRHIANRFSKVPGMAVDYATDKLGNLAFAYSNEAGKIILHYLEGESWKRSPVDLEEVTVITCGEKPGELVVLGPETTGKPRALQFMDAATGKLGDVIMQDSGYDFDGYLYRDPVSHSIVGAIYNKSGPSVTWFTEEYRTLQKSLEAMFPGLVVRIMGCNDAGTIYIVKTFSDKQPAAYFSVDLTKRQVGLIKQSRPWIDPKRMRSMNVIKYKTRDGRQLDAYLTLPAGASKTNKVPLLVYPHGGPFTRDNWGYDSVVQFFASRGYAVLQPNFRGSTSYCWQSSLSEEWDFLKMSDDVTDATKTILKTGYLDPSRIAIMGGAFGGYLAIAGVTHEPDLYRCAITEAGVFDWALMVQDAKHDRYDRPQFDGLLRYLGDPKKEKAKYDAISPIKLVNRIKVPVFVAAGKDDRTVDIAQSKQLISELKKCGIPHQTLLVSGEGHGMAKVDNQVKLYSQVEEFLRQNMAPVPTEAKAAAQP